MRKESFNWVNFLLILTGVLLLWFVWPFFDFWLSPSLRSAPESEVVAMQGQIGDRFGGLNALFTGLTLSAILVTFFTERKARIESQRETQIALRIAQITAQLEALPRLIDDQRAKIEALANPLSSSNSVSTHLVPGWSHEIQKRVRNAISKFELQIARANYLEHQIGEGSSQVPPVILKQKAQFEQALLEIERLLQLIELKEKLFVELGALVPPVASTENPPLSGRASV